MSDSTMDRITKIQDQIRRSRITTAFLEALLVREELHLLVEMDIEGEAHKNKILEKELEVRMYENFYENMVSSVGAESLLGGRT